METYQGYETELSHSISHCRSRIKPASQLPKKHSSSWRWPPISWTWNLEANRCPADHSGLWLHASHHTTQELSCPDKAAFWVCVRYTLSEWAQMVLWPRQRGKDQNANLNIIIKNWLNAHCVQRPVLSSWGISERAGLWSQHWTDSVVQGSKAQWFNTYQ